MRKLPTRNLICIALVVTYSNVAIAAGVYGLVTDTNGVPLARVPVCLMSTAYSSDCLKVHQTNKRGRYSFKFNKKTNASAIRVYASASPSARKTERYKTYVWAPTIGTFGGDSERVDFVGKFNFSNFQRILRLTDSDFPELARFDPALDIVMIKVFLLATNEIEQEVIFLGQVDQLDGFIIEASIPLAVTTIYYEIFGTSSAASGSIDVTSG